MTDENVIPLPTRLERLAKTIQEALTGIKANRENIFLLCVSLYEARQAHKSDQAFGEWCGQYTFDIDKDARAAGIAMGAEPNVLKAVLPETDRTSLRRIYEQFRSRFLSPEKPRGRPRGTPSPRPYAPTQKRMDPTAKRPQEDKARAEVRARVDAGIAFDARKLADETGISHAMVEQAAAVERAVDAVHREYAEMPLVDFDTIPATMKVKVDAIRRRLERDAERTLKARLAAIDEEVRQRVLKETEEHLALLKRRQEEVNEEYTRYVNLNNDYKPIYTEEEWKTLFRVCHPDNSASGTMRASAFNLIRDKKLQLTGKK